MFDWTLPLVGEVPGRMVAQVVRQDRLGDPINAFEIEEIYVPSIKADEVLVGVMAAGINYNNVWAARGIPIEIIATRQKAGSVEDVHVGGSDASGIVTRVLRFDEIGRAHQEMDEGRHGIGNTAILVGAPEPGLGRRITW